MSELVLKALIREMGTSGVQLFSFAGACLKSEECVQVCKLRWDDLQPPS